MSTPKGALSHFEISPDGAQSTVSDTADFVDDRSATEDGQRALLNILEDFAAEKRSLEGGQRAMLNILDDFDAEKARMEGAQRAVLNILEDSVAEKTQLEAAQRSMLNILDDSSEEKARLEETQRAVLNILDDFEMEKSKVELTNQQLEKEIDERKRVETQIQRVNTQLLAANKELEAFSYSVSHDLRAPLRGIDGFSQALLEDHADRLDATGKQCLERVRNAAQRMAALIDDLLALSRITRAQIERQPVNLSEMARSVASELARQDPARKVDFVIAPGLRAEADGRLVRTVLENLLGNAWKFSSRRSRARIEFGRTQTDGLSAFFVRDNGAGFDPAYSSRLFGAFQRLHAAGEFPGTGVGLASVQRVISRHGGRLWAQSAVDQGATFFFTLNQDGGASQHGESQHLREAAELASPVPEMTVSRDQH